MASKKDIQEMLVSMGFQPNYIQRAFKVYEKNYGHSYNVEVITEIIVRLQNKDKTKMNKKKQEQQQSQVKHNAKPKAPPQKPPKPMKSKPSPTKPAKPKPKPPPADNKAVNINMDSQKKQNQMNYRHNYSQSASVATHNMGNVAQMKRNSSNPSNKNLPPIQQAQHIQHNSYNNANNQQSQPKIHAKNPPQPNMLPASHAQYKAQQQQGRQSPHHHHNNDRFKAKDIVIYQGKYEAEVMRVCGDNQYEISYPTSKFVMKRTTARVYGQNIEKKRISSQQQQQNVSPQQQRNNVQFNIIPKHQQRPPKAPSQQIPIAKVAPQKPLPVTQQSVDNNNNDSNNSKIAPFISHMTMEDALKLSVHEKIDHRDQVGRFVFATVSEKQGSNLKIHYDGWSRKWDTWSDFSVELHRFAGAGSISLRASHRSHFLSLKKGDYVDINPSQRHPGWKVGEIRRLDQKSGQVQVVYEYLDKNYLYWAHLDNDGEIAQFPTKSSGAEANNNNNIKAAKSNKEEVAQIESNKEVAAVDEMEAWSRIRAKRFPRYADEEISNKYGIGEWLEVQDTQTLQWITATVIDKENNWICVHFDGWPSKYDQKIHVLKHARRLRALGAELGETQEEKDIREEMESFLHEVEELNWKLIEVDADGNCLYRCFAINIYNDTTKHMLVRSDCCRYMRENNAFFVNFIPDFEERMKEKEAEYEWGDHVDITALSELYNVRVRVFEYDIQQKKLYMSFDLGEHEETVNLPLILLARHRKKHYNIICDPQAVHKRPLGTAEERSANEVCLREIRLNEDAKQEHKEKEAKENGDDDEEKEAAELINLNADKFKNIYLAENEFIDVVETWNLSPPLNINDLQNCFETLIKKIHRKLLAEYEENEDHRELINKQILDRFWDTQFNGNNNINKHFKKWTKSLKEKIPNGKYPISAAATSFNQSIVASIVDNLQSIKGQSRKRQSTITNAQQQLQSHQNYQKQQQRLNKQKQQQSQPMDIDR